MNDTQKRNIEDMRRQGMGYKRIAGILGLSENTVKSYCRRQKLEAPPPPAEPGGVEDKPVCKHCGKPLEPSTRSKTYCSSKCR